MLDTVSRLEWILQEVMLYASQANCFFKYRRVTGFMLLAQYPAPTAAEYIQALAWCAFLVV